MFRFSELLNKVWGLADLIKARFSRGYAKTVDQSCFQRGDRACGLLDKLFWLLLLPSYWIQKTNISCSKNKLQEFPLTMKILKYLIYVSMVSWHLFANSQVTQEIVNLKTRDDVTMRVLLLSPKEPKVSLILFAGGHGGLRIFPNGSMQWGENNFLIRTKSH